ncbi:Putative Mitochondrial folate carrier protein Flx1 [Aspergillus calidoustus]|uniref:Putative Mitochondrial folate carrier protein Flx1 n=1 Tax=Aspergillus calidoustus TaxID=454130 RepID=A0A0U5C2B4_ASPCI|nr:Putative Mitochondrial folate carrier protein Flx1 [Aspergillus calidoustus]
MTGKDGWSSSVVETIAGFTAGIATTLCLHPLDLIKTRLQVDRTYSSRVGGSLRIIRQIFHDEGGLAAFYRGLTPNIIGNSTSWALYFLLYGDIKDAISNWRLRHSPKDGSQPQQLTSSDYFIASGTAGALTSVLTNPIWVIKTRMLATGSKSPGAYTSFITGAVQILRSEGLPGFYRGLVPSLFGVSHGALQFMAYEKLKLYRTRVSLLDTEESASSRATAAERKRELNNLDFFVTSSISKIFAGSITYPYQVLRSRLQTYDAHIAYRGLQDAIAQIWVTEGLGGFYKGLGPNLFRVLPSTWVTFLVYENTRSYLPRRLLGS